MPFCSLAGMMGCLKRMGMGGMGVMSCLFGMTGSVLRGRLLVMLHGMLVMFGGLGVMSLRRMLLVRWILGHVSSPF